MLDSEPMPSTPRQVSNVASVPVPAQPGQADFDEIVTFAWTHLQTPIAAVSLIDRETVWFTSAVGIAQAQFAREDSFCDYVISGGCELIVPDALKDRRFSKISLVSDYPKVRFYAGVPLRVSGEWVGAMCILDRRQRAITPRQLGILRFLGRQVQHLIELHGLPNARLSTGQESVIGGERDG